MKTAHLTHSSPAGWSGDLPASMDGPRTLVIAFGARSLLDDPHALCELAGAFPASVVMGCSSAGEIASGSVGDGGLSVAIGQFEATSLVRASTALNGAADSFDAGRRLAEQFPPEGLRALFMLSGGLDINGAELVRGIADVLPQQVPISGGLAADGSLFERTWVLDEHGVPREAMVTAVGLYGPALRVSHGCSGGWTEFGPERRVTRSSGNVLYELDGQPALTLYKHYLGDLASQLPGSALRFPLALRADHDGDAVVRTILAVDEAAQSMTFAGDIPTGALVRLMRTSIDRLVTSAEEAARQATAPVGGEDSVPHGPMLALSVSCIGRRLVMGERTEEEVEAVVEQLPQGASHAGFYSYGEVSPTHGLSGAQLHNQTITLTLLSEH